MSDRALVALAVFVGGVVLFGLAALAVHMQIECDGPCATIGAVDSKPTREGLCACVMSDRSVVLRAP